MARLRLRGGIISGAPPPDPPPGGSYTFPTTAFNFPLLPDDGGTFSNDGLINVADYGLVPNDSSAAVANRVALQSMMTANQENAGTSWSRKTIFFPNGTWYLSGLGSNTRGIIEKKDNTPHFTAGLRIQGQSEAGAIIRLADNDSGFQSSADPRFIIYQSNQAGAGGQPHYDSDGLGLEGYRQIIRDLTIDLGSGNSGAVGINVAMHNIGAIRRVTVQDAVGTGRTSNRALHAFAGLAEERQGAGPSHLSRITVKGCQYGFRLAQLMCGQGIEHLRIVNPGTCGVITDSNGLFIRGFVAENMTVPVAEIRTGDSWNHFSEAAEFLAQGWEHASNGNVMTGSLGYLLIVDGVFSGTASSVAAIRNQASGAKMFLRNITTTGFLRAAEEGGSPVQSGAATIAEYATPPTHNLWGQSVSSINMPIRNTPERGWSDISQWTSVTDATPGFPNGVEISHAGGTQFNNSWAALQSAIDNCTTDTLYFPSARNGRVKFAGSGTIHVDNPDLKHIVGMGAEFSSTVAGSALDLTFDQATRPAGSETVTWEDIRMESGSNLQCHVHLDTPRDVVFMDGHAWDITNTAGATGTLFVENVQSASIDFSFPQNVFTRQQDCDNDQLFTSYVGGDYWAFYVKCEPHVENSARRTPANWDGRVEILGGWHSYQPNAGEATTAGVPIFEVTNGAAITAELSVAGFATSTGGTTGSFSLYGTETQNSVNRDLLPGGAVYGAVTVPALAARGTRHHVTLYRSKF